VAREMLPSKIQILEGELLDERDIARQKYLEPGPVRKEKDVAISRTSCNKINHSIK
jgi:hypothetical protein